MEMDQLEVLDKTNHKLSLITKDIYLNILNKYDLHLLSEKIDVSYFILNSVKNGLYLPSDLIVRKLINFEEQQTNTTFNIMNDAEARNINCEPTEKEKEESKKTKIKRSLYRLRHKESISEYQKLYYRRNKAKIKMYHQYSKKDLKGIEI